MSAPTTKPGHVRPASLLGQYSTAQRAFYRAAREYALTFSDFNDGRADEVALACAENALDRAAILAVKRGAAVGKVLDAGGSAEAIADVDVDPVA